MVCSITQGDHNKSSAAAAMGDRFATVDTGGSLQMQAALQTVFGYARS